MSRMAPLSGCVSCGILALSLGAAACRSSAAQAADDPKGVIQRALRAAGGEQALRAVMATRAEVQTAHFQLGQETRPGGLPVMDVRIGTIIRDFANMRMRLTAEHRGGARWGERFSSVPFRAVVTPNAGFEQQGRWLNAAGPEWARAQSVGMQLLPERILLTALEAQCMAVDRRGASGAPNDAGPSLQCTGKGMPEPVTLHFDGLTGHLAASAVRAHDAMRGRHVVVTRYGEYQPVTTDETSGLRVMLPRSVQVELDGRLRSATQYGRVEVIPIPNDTLFAIPDSLASRREPSLPATTEVTRLADGVFHIGSGEYYTLAVIQGDSIVLLEAPDTPERARVMLDAVRSVSPAPVRMIVNSHHHLDHIGGLRHAFSARIPVMTHWANVDYLRQFARENGDTAANEPRLVGVREPVVIGSGTRAIHIYSAPNFEGEAFLIGYMPALRLLWAPDVGEGGASAELRRVVRALGIAVDRVAPGHVRAWPWPDTARVSQRATRLVRVVLRYDGRRWDARHFERGMIARFTVH